MDRSIVRVIEVALFAVAGAAIALALREMLTLGLGAVAMVVPIAWFAVVGFVAGRRGSPIGLVAMIVLAIATGWVVGSQYDWSSGRLRSETSYSGGSGLYPYFWAGMAGVLSFAGGIIGWVPGARIRSRAARMRSPTSPPTGPSPRE